MIETPRWHLMPARLSGEIGYQYRAEGIGPYEGIAVIWGPPRSGGCVGDRRFKLKIGSKPLWRRRSEGGDAYAELRYVLDSAAGELWQRAPADRECAVRRVDACVDHWGYTWTRFDLGRFAARASTRAADERPADDDEKPVGQTHVYQGKVSATYEIGARGGASCFLRVYNKTVEARAKGKLTWMEPAWRACGWDGEATVWRAEIEAGGQWCQDHGLETIAELHGIEHALLRRYFEVTRHTRGTATRNKRSRTSAVWNLLCRLVERDAARASTPATWEWSPRKPRMEADSEILGDVGQGCTRKLGDRLFPGWQRDEAQRVALFDYMFSLMQRGATRAAEREAREQVRRLAKLARDGPAPPAPPPEPKPRRVSQLVARAELRGDHAAAAMRSYVTPRQARNHARPREA